MPFTDYARNRLLDHTMARASFTMPGGVWLALSTSDPGVSGSLSGEVPSGRNYSRQTLAVNAASSGAAANTSIITFGPCLTTNWGTVTHFFTVDSLTLGAGNALIFGALTTSKTIDINDSLQFAASGVTFTLT